MIESHPRWDSQPYPPEGASAAEGIRNQLGRPALDLLTVLVREAAQNSWDARSDQPGITVRFGVDVHTVAKEYAPLWRDLLLRGAPRDPNAFPLREALAHGPIRVIEVSDRGTKGLGGPTRADVVTDGPRDFVTFVRNVGEPRDNTLGGGTYGFGKGIFFMLSKAHAILIHTRTEHEGRLETRLIGSCLAHGFTESTNGEDVRYTGRHWWGNPTAGLVEPLFDDEAEDVADRLGLRQFAPDETGTTIVVIDPDLTDGVDGPDDLGTYLADTVMWQLWPKMLPRADDQATMQFDVQVEGLTYPVPDPATTAPVNLFVEAYRQLATSDGRDIECKRPRRLLGRLGLHETFVPGWKVTRAAETAGLTSGLVHHVCLMRPAELVVTYHPGIEPQAEFKGYAGVFRADDSLDDVFSKAEPPTHDGWLPDSLPTDERTLVRAVFLRLREIQQDLMGLKVVVGPGGQGVALGAASNYFSRLVRGSGGFGGRSAGPDTRTGGGVGSGGGSTTLGSGRRMGGHSTVRVWYENDPYVEHQNGETVVVQEFRLPSQTVTLRARLSIAVSIDAAGRERDITDPPIVRGWVRPDGTHESEATPTVTGDDDGIWKLVVRAPADAMVVLDVLAEEVGS